MSSPRKSEERAKDWVRSVLEEKLTHQRRRAREILKTLIEKRRKLTKRDVEKGMKILCYKHLAYCCGIEKKCGYRDSLLNAIGMTKADYIEYKKSCGVLLQEFLASNGLIS